MRLVEWKRTRFARGPPSVCSLKLDGNLTVMLGKFLWGYILQNNRCSGIKKKRLYRKLDMNAYNRANYAKLNQVSECCSVNLDHILRIQTKRKEANDYFLQNI